MRKNTFGLQLCILLAICCIFSSPAKLSAQTIDEWQILRRIPAGQKLEVIEVSRQKRTVQLLEATDEGLRVISKGRELMIARADVRKVTRVDSRMMRRFCIGLAIGGGGAIGGLVFGSKYAANEGGGVGAWTGCIAAGGAAGGAAIGALLGLNPKRTVVYERASPERKHVDFQEHSSTGIGFGPAIGVGLRDPFTRRLSIRPELSLWDATAGSSANLKRLRLSLGIRYAW